jgi:hypothetical protein
MPPTSHIVRNLAEEINVIGQMRSDYSDRVYRMADCNYSGNGSCTLTMVALAAAQ